MASQGVGSGTDKHGVRGLHRAWWVVGGTFLTIVAAGAFATMGGLLVDPLHHEFAWSHADVGVALSVSMILYGLTAPFAAALMDRVGLRRVVVGALVTLALGAALTTTITQSWQFMLYWGLLTGLGTGSLALTFAATVTNRWFVHRRGLVTGVLSSASVLGQFLFLPVLGWIVQQFHWRPALLTLTMTAAIAAPLSFLLIRNHPQDVGLQPYGAADAMSRPVPTERAARRTVRALLSAIRTGPFWLLAASFAICGASTNGVMWTHFVPAAQMHGMAVPVAASMLTLVGVFNIVGTVGSGWLTDRSNPSLLLGIYFALRGASLLLLPGILGPDPTPGLITFAVAFGILDLATVPPMIALCQALYGHDGAIVFGWVNAAHQVGAAAAAAIGGVIRDGTGSYNPVWYLVGTLCFAAAILAQFVARGDRATISMT